MTALADIRARMGGSDARLIAVSKTFAADAVRPLLAEGQRVFGENRVQEAAAKWPALRAEFEDVALHLIGPLQTNKAAAAVALFDAIHTIDRPRVAAAVAHAMAESGRRPELFVQVNIGREKQKAGVAPEELAALLDTCRHTLDLAIAGLMCIPPMGDDARPHFEALAELARAHGVTRLSMGMSADFEVALAAGATDIRIGSALFGQR